MGPCTSKQKKDEKYKQNSADGNNFQMKPIQKNKNDKLAEVRFMPQNLIHEKFSHITQEYQLINPPLGKGAFGEVRKAIHRASGITRAVKIIKKDAMQKGDQEKLVNEVQILKRLDHPHIIKILEFYQDDSNFYIVTDMCTGGELFDKIIEEKTFSERKAAELMKQILSAVFYCHQHKIVHRDLKPENLLYESKNSNIIKIIDFGTSKEFDPSSKMNQKFGTPYYIAPEVLSRNYNEKCDIWSLGVILFILLSGIPPFNGPNDNVIMEKVKKGVFSFSSKEWIKVSVEAKDLITHMLNKDISTRYSAEQCLNHPWVQKFNNEQVDLPLMQTALNNMKNFREEKKMQEASWMFLVQYFTSQEERNQLMKTFKVLDTNGDGVLSKEELQNGYLKIMDKETAYEYVDQIMDVCDKDKNGFIDYTEFVIATANRQNMLQKEKLQSAFRMFDTDNSGQLDVGELKSAFGDLQNESIWKQIIQEIDQDGDGLISFKEFESMMLKLLESNTQMKKK